MAAPVSVVGLGGMGEPIAERILAAGYPLSVFNRTAAKAQQWAKEYGGKSAATPREAAKDCEFVMMCVGNDHDLRSVVFGAADVTALPTRSGMRCASSRAAASSHPIGGKLRRRSTTALSRGA